MFKELLTKLVAFGSIRRVNSSIKDSGNCKYIQQKLVRENGRDRQIERLIGADTIYPVDCMESSSVVEPSAVNRLVVSSNLTSPVSKKYSEKVLTSSEYSV